MNFSVIPTDKFKFKKEAKRLVKKYRSLKQELATLNSLLEIEPTKGTPLGNNTYKIRLSMKKQREREKCRVESYNLRCNK